MLKSDKIVQNGHFLGELDLLIIVETSEVV